MFIDHPYLTVLVFSIAVLIIENLPIERLRWNVGGWNINQFQGKYFIFMWSRHDEGVINIQIYPGCKCDDCQHRRKGR